MSILAKPTQWLTHLITVGPAAPSNYAMNIETRYTKEMFSSPRPQFTESRLRGRNLLNSPVSSNKDKASNLLKEVLKPLPALSQPPGGAIGFFEQGLFIGVGFLSIPIMGGIAALSYKGVRSLLRKR